MRKRPQRVTCVWVSITNPTFLGSEIFLHLLYLGSCLLFHGAVRDKVCSRAFLPYFLAVSKPVTWLKWGRTDSPTGFLWGLNKWVHEVHLERCQAQRAQYKPATLQRWECLNEEIMSFLLCFISTLAGNAVLVLQFFYWHFIGLWNPRVDIMTYDLEVTVTQTQAYAKGADQEDGLKVGSSGLSSGGSPRWGCWSRVWTQFRKAMEPI